MNHKLSRSFYQRPAEEVAKAILGNYLVHQMPQGRISARIIEVEAYPAFVDQASHGNKRTPRTEVMYREGGYAYVYLIYGIHHLFAVVVNRPEMPEVVFLRAAIPDEGIDLMRRNLGRPAVAARDLTKSPGNLCGSFGITVAHWGMDLTGDVLFLEDRGDRVREEEVISCGRVGINPAREGSQAKLRFLLRSHPPAAGSRHHSAEATNRATCPPE